MKLSRRRLLEFGWKIGAGLLGLAGVWTSLELLRPLKTAGATGPIIAGPIGDFKKNEPIEVPAGRFWVVNVNGHPIALSQKCPHLGCRVPFKPETGRFECPCHGSVFEINGELVKGPAPRGLDRYKVVKIDADGNLIVDTSIKISGPELGGKYKSSDPAHSASGEV